MQRVMPDQLSGPSAYFTDFDSRILKRASKNKNFRVQKERKLKALLLTKTNITFAASHLASEFTIDFFRSCPLLLTSGAIIPTLREDTESIEQLFDRKPISGKRSAIEFYHDSIPKVVNWNKDDNTLWFWRKLKEDTNDARSVLLLDMADDGKNALHEIIETHENPLTADSLSISEITQGIAKASKTRIHNYIELLYHMSGARVVNSESILPQENYLDYDFADYKSKRTRLTDEEIVTKFIIEAVYDSISPGMFCGSILDSLSFEDILKIRLPLLETNFRIMYDSITKTVVNSNSPRPNNFFSIDELEKIRNELSSVFSRIIQLEVPYYARREREHIAREYFGSFMSLFCGLTSFVPNFPVSTGSLIDIGTTAHDGKTLLVNLYSRFRSKKAIDKKDAYLIHRTSVVKYLLNNQQNRDNLVFISFVEYLSNIVRRKMKIEA